MKRSYLFLLFRPSKSTMTKKIAMNAILTISTLIINTQTITHARINTRNRKISFPQKQKDNAS